MGGLEANWNQVTRGVKQKLTTLKAKSEIEAMKSENSEFKSELEAAKTIKADHAKMEDQLETGNYW